MATRGSLKDAEEHAPGNADDTLNPANKKFNEDYVKDRQAEGNQEGVDRALNGASNAGSKKGPAVDSHGDTIQPNYNSDAGRQDLANKEAGGDSLFNNGKGGGSTNVKGTTTGAMMSMLPGRFKNMAGKFGPTGGVVGILLFGLLGLGGGSGLLGASLLINVKEIFHNDRADASRINRVMSRAFISNKFNNNDKGCKKKTPICTKMTSMSKEQVKQWETSGFKIKGKIVDAQGNKGNDYNTNDKIDENGDSKADGLKDGERIQVDNVTYPDGSSAGNGRDLFGAADSKPSMLRRLETAFATKAAFYTNKFFENNIMKKLLPNAVGSPKDQAKYTEGDDENAQKAQDDQFNSEGGFVTDPNDREKEAEKILSQSTGKTEAAKDKSQNDEKKPRAKGAIGTLIRGVCSVYQVAHLAQTYLKMYHLAQLTAFALLFFRAADEIKDGKGDGSLVTHLAEQLTWYQPASTADTQEKKDRIDLTATDSEGYQAAAHGRTKGLMDFSKKFLLGGDIGHKVSSFTDKFENAANKVPSSITGGATTGRQKMKAVCQIINSKEATIAAGCIGVFGALEAIGSIAPGVGNLVGAGVTIGMCACTVGESLPVVDRLVEAHLGPVPLTGCAAVQDATQYAVNKAMESFTKNSVIQKTLKDILAQLDISSNTKGVDAGNAIAAGAGLMLSKTAMGYGQRPSVKDGNHKDISDYISYTQPLQDEYIALDKEDGKNSPFDPYNQYSLTGTLVRSLADPNNSTPPSTVFGLFSTLPNLYTTALKMATGQPTAEALYNQPSMAANGASGRYENCPDSNDPNGDLGNINVTADIYCDVVGVNSVQELQDANRQAYTPGDTTINDLIDWMQQPQSKVEGNDKDSGTACDNSKEDPLDSGSCDKAGELASIDDNGKYITGSQYDKYLQYCTDQRAAPFGDQLEGEYAETDRDQGWYSGKECTNDTEMLRNFRAYTNYCLQSATMDGMANCYDNAAAASTASPLTQNNSGACGLASNPNIVYVNPKTKEGLDQICQKGQTLGVCGSQVSLDPNLVNDLNTLSSKYKVLVNNFGINGDRNDCDGGQHPKGKAVDINGIQELNGGSAGGTNWGSINYGDANQVKVLNDFTTDFLANLPGNAGGIGQAGCNAAFKPTFPGGSNGGNFFSDSCDHLHIDVRGG